MASEMTSIGGSEELKASQEILDAQKELSEMFDLFDNPRMCWSFFVLGILFSSNLEFLLFSKHPSYSVSCEHTFNR